MRALALAVGLLCLASAIFAAPIPAADVGEGGLMGPHEVGLGSNKLMMMAEKIWRKGENADGSENLDKMEGALDKVEEKGLEKVEVKTERQIERHAIESHDPHPMKMVKEESKEIARGIKMAENEVGDDLGQFNKAYDIGIDKVKKQGGDVEPNIGAKMDESIKQAMHLSTYAEKLKQAMETYTPPQSLLEVGETAPADIKVDSGVVTHATTTQGSIKAAGHKALAKSVVDFVEGVQPAKKETAAKAPAKKAPAKKAPAKKAPAKKAPAKKASPVEKTAATRTPGVKVQKSIDSIMNEVKGDVDLQFAPVEEQLGYNLHQEAAMALKESQQEQSRSMREQGSARKHKDIREANALALAAQHAEEEAAVMKKAVNFAKKEHADGAPTVPGAEVFLQESEAPAFTSVGDLHPDVQRMAIKKIKEENALDDVLQKAMRKGERTLNTELAPVMPQAMKSNHNDDLLDRQLKSKDESMGVMKETEFIMHMHAAEAKKVRDGIFNDEFIQTGYKMEAAPLGDTTGRVEHDIHEEMNFQHQIDQLTQASIVKAEKDDQHAFGHLAAEMNPKANTFDATQQLQSRMNAIGQMVEDANIKAQERVATGYLPNGVKATPLAHLTMVPLPHT